MSALRHDATQAAIVMVAVLGSLASAIALREAAGLSAQVPVLAVVLTVTLSRIRPQGHQRIVGALELALVALAAAGVGWLLVHEQWVGQPLLVLGLSAGIMARRYGPVVRAGGRLLALPFVALLITPVPVVPGHAASSILWTPVVAVIALAWTTAVRAAVNRFTTAPTTRPADAAQPTRASRRRLDAATRMALQMASGLAVALVVGHLLFGDRWTWTLLSAYLVASGNRGRGDVVHKAGLRVAGALAGTVLATLAGTGLPEGHRFTLVLLFATMAVALTLRPRSYAWWAAGVTAMVALLHSYYGEPAASALGERLLGVLVGSLIGVAAAWFVTPVRTREVFRRRVADCLAALTDDLATDCGDHSSFPHAVAQLDQLAPALRAHGRLARRTPGPRLIDAVTALHELQPLPCDDAERKQLRTATVRVRRAMVGRDDPSPEHLPAALATVHAALQLRRGGASD